MSLFNVLSATPRSYLLDVVRRRSEFLCKFFTVGQRLSNLANIIVRQLRDVMIRTKWDGSVTMPVSRIRFMCSPFHAMRRMWVYAQSIVARSVASQQASGVSIGKHYQCKTMGVNRGAIVTNVSIAAAIDGVCPFNAYIAGIVSDNAAKEVGRRDFVTSLTATPCLSRIKVASGDGGTVSANTYTVPDQLLMSISSCKSKNGQLSKNFASKVANAGRAWFNFIHDVIPSNQDLRNREALRDHQSPTLLAL